jgi:hypothetical protein
MAWSMREGATCPLLLILDAILVMGSAIGQIMCVRVFLNPLSPSPHSKPMISPSHSPSYSLPTHPPSLFLREGGREGNGVGKKII